MEIPFLSISHMERPFSTALHARRPAGILQHIQYPLNWSSGMVLYSSFSIFETWIEVSNNSTTRAQNNENGEAETIPHHYTLQKFLFFFFLFSPIWHLLFTGTNLLLFIQHPSSSISRKIIHLKRTLQSSLGYKIPSTTSWTFVNYSPQSQCKYISFFYSLLAHYCPIYTVNG